jgi:hypothetical protein
MTYIPSSGSSGDLGRFHIIKPDQSTPAYSNRFLRFDISSTNGWCDRRVNNPSYGTADPDGWEVVRNDLKSPKNTNGYTQDGHFESGTYSVYLRHTHRAPTIGVTHFSYPGFTGLPSGVTVTTELPSISNGSPVASAPTTELEYYEQGGLFHISLSLKFVFSINGYWSGITTYFMVAPGTYWYGSSYGNYVRASGPGVDTGAETKIIKLA